MMKNQLLNTCEKQYREYGALIAVVGRSEGKSLKNGSHLFFRYWAVYWKNRSGEVFVGIIWAKLF